MRPIDADALIEKLDIDKTNIMRYLSILKSTNLNDGYDIFVSTIQIGEVDRFRDMIEEAPTVETPGGEWISVEDRLPEENVAVLIWSRSISIAKLEKGITMAKREAMKKGEIDDPESIGWNSSNGWFWIKRSDAIRPCDEWGNNLKPYCWETVCGVGQYFGQDVKYWMPLPEKPDMRGEGE